MAQIRKFALSGFSRSDETEFSQLFKQAASRSGGAFELCAEADAQALIIDVDSIYGQMGLMQAQSSGKLLIALTAGSRADADHVLPSPATEEALVALLSRLSGEASRAAPPRQPPRPAAPAAPATPASSSAPPRSAAPEARRAAPDAAAAPVPPAPMPAAAPQAPQAPRERSLFEYLQPGALSGPVILERGEAPPLVIDPANRSYFGGAALKPYAGYLRGVLPEGALKPLPAARLPELEAQLGGRQPIQRLLWLAALHAGEGQLIGFDAGTRFKLAKWPQIEREYPKHFRIATVMMKSAATVEEIASASGATREEVCDLLNAYLAIGFAEPEQVQASAAVETARNGLLDRLRGLRG